MQNQQTPEPQSVFAPHPTENQMPVEPPKPQRFSPRLIIGVLIATIVVLVFVVVGLLSRRWGNLTGPAPTQAPAAPTPTPVRVPSKLATESGFLNLEANVASLSAIIAAYPLDDPSLAPPMLELPLGFSN